MSKGRGEWGVFLAGVLVLLCISIVFVLTGVEWWMLLLLWVVGIGSILWLLRKVRQAVKEEQERKLAEQHADQPPEELGELVIELAAEFMDGERCYAAGITKTAAGRWALKLNTVDVELQLQLDGTEWRGYPLVVTLGPGFPQALKVS
jgi:hypothetical protein